MAKDNAIRKLRKLLVLDQREFAIVMNVDAGTISRWERDTQRPRPRHLRKMERLRKKVLKKTRRG